MNSPQEDELMEGLRALASASMNEEAPARVEEGLRRAFRAHATVAKPPVRRWPWIAFAAAGSVAAGVFWFRAAAPPPPAIVAPQVVAQARAADTARVAPVSEAPRVIPQPRRRRKQPPAPPPVELVTDFLTVQQGDEWTPLEGARLMRVELPKSALGAFGLPVNEERALEPVKADVMLSDDGLLRAIRFVQ